MNGPCPVINSDTSGAQTMVEAVDCFVKTSVQDNYAALMGAGSSFNQGLTLLLTLYVAILGYQLIFGQSSLNLRDIAPKMLLVGGVLALATNWSAYQVLLFDVLTDGPQEIVSMISPQAGGTDMLMARVDTLTNHIVDAAEVWTESGKTPAPDATAAKTPAAAAVPLPAPQASIGPNLLLLSAMLVMLTSAGILVVAKALLGLLLALGPLFLALALFRFTRGLAMGWLRVATLLALVPVLVLIMTYGALTVLEPLAVQLTLAVQNDIFSLRMAATLLVASVVIAAIGLQLFRMATAITAQWTNSSAANTSMSRSFQAEMPSSPLAPAAAALSGNARIDTLISAMERTTVTSAPQTAAVQRMIVLPGIQQSSAGPSPTGNTMARRTFSGPMSARPGNASGLLRPVRG
jgi:type IV secretion system protein VirB6